MRIKGLVFSLGLVGASIAAVYLLGKKTVDEGLNSIRLDADTMGMAPDEKSSAPVAEDVVEEPIEEAPVEAEQEPEAEAETDEEAPAETQDDELFSSEPFVDINGKVVCPMGYFACGTWDAAIAKLKEHGAIVRVTPSGRVNIVVVGERTTLKTLMKKNSMQTMIKMKTEDHKPLLFVMEHQVFADGEDSEASAQ
jgi:NAD-dependent DNA ligase